MRERLQAGRFLRRYKRFFADVERGSETLVTHCPNTGSMKTLLAEVMVELSVNECYFGFLGSYTGVDPSDCFWRTYKPQLPVYK